MRVEYTVSSTPLVVTHPCALVRDALQGIFSKSQFRPLHILPTADVVAENHPGEGGFSIWLVGVRECPQPQTTWCDEWLAQTPR